MVDYILFALIGLLIGVLVNWLSNILPPKKSPLPYRTPLVVIAGTLAFAILPTRFNAVEHLILASVFTAVFLLVLVIDMEHRLILNVVILPATLFAVLASPFWRVGAPRAILGGALGYLVVLGIYGFAGVFARWRGYGIRVPFGFGDVKLAGFMGLVTGLPGVITALLLAILVGGAGALVFLAYEGIAHRRLALSAAIPYGPSFCIAGWIAMVARF